MIVLDDVHSGRKCVRHVGKLFAVKKKTLSLTIAATCKDRKISPKRTHCQLSSLYVQNPLLNESERALFIFNFTS